MTTRKTTAQKAQREQMTYMCVEGRHGDNSRAHLAPMSARQIYDSGAAPYTFTNACAGLVRTGDSFDSPTARCACLCHS